MMNRTTIWIIILNVRRINSHCSTKPYHRQRRNPKLGQYEHEEMFLTFYVAIGNWFDNDRWIMFDLSRFIPRRIDLDCDFALDALVSQNLHPTRTSTEQQQILRQQRRVKKRMNEQIQTNSARKTLQLLEHFMPQNRRIYNFGVKTLRPRPIGKQNISFFSRRSIFLVRSQWSCSTNWSIDHHIQRTIH